MTVDPSIIQAMVAYAAVMGGFYLVVTRPLMKRMDDIRADLAGFKVETHNNFAAAKSETHGDFAGVHAELREIRTELKSHGERLTRVEERLPPPLVHR